MRFWLLAFGLLGLGACTIRTNDTTDQGPSASGTATTYAKPAVTPALQKTGGIAEEVYVFMRDVNGDGWMCTGTLVANDIVVTAGHCLEPKQFVSYWIVAPLAPGKPVVMARNPKIFGGSYEDVANPDIGFLTLEKPVILPAYAELTDVVADVEAGESVQGAAVVRTSEEPEAPFEVESGLTVTSTVEYGYEHGFGTPMFSKGGDSGAGLYLVENGKPAHKLIGVARQPEPTRNLDHFTRIDGDFIAWFKAQTNAP